MKNLKYLLFVFVVVFGFMLNINAEEVVYSQEVVNLSEEKLYEITIKSNELSSDLELVTYGDVLDFSYVLDGYKIYSEKKYNYKLVDKTTDNAITELDNDSKVEILINQDNLVEGRKYDVYYFDSLEYPCVLDEDNLGDKAEVVSIDGKLYIKIVTSILKPFVLEMEMSEEYRKAFEKISTDGYYLFPAVKPSGNKFAGSYETLLMALKKDEPDIEISFVDCIENSEYQYIKLSFNSIEGETHIVKFKCQEEDIPKHLSSKFNRVENNILKNNEPLDKIAEGRKGIYFEVDDLNYINFLANNKYSAEDGGIFEGAINYSSELRNIFENSNFKYYFDFRAGNGEPFVKLSYGFMSIGYDGLIYAFNFQTGMYIKQVIYIPDDTKDTQEAYIAAAKKRITEYLGVDDVKIEVGGTREEISKEFNLEAIGIWKKFYDEEKLSDYYYNITINDQTQQFVFEKNSEKIKEIEFKTKDLESDIEINSSSGEIPLDTLIEVNEIIKGDQKFDEILKKLNKDNGMIFDLKLYSNSKKKYINKLDNGKFEVRIPLKDEFKDKKLKAFYINDDDKIEEYDITIENGFAVFETDHFSTYTIAEVDEIVNPDTGNNTILSILIASISLVILILLKKKTLKNY